MGRTMGEERSTAHKHGYCVVVCRLARSLDVEEERWTTETESLPCAGDHAHWMGHGCTSAESRAKHPCA